MKILTSSIFFALLLNFNLALHAQKSDTLQITAANINTNVLREGTHRYLVYFKMKKDSVRTQTQFWTRTIKRTSYNNQPVIQINQQ